LIPVDRAGHVGEAIHLAGISDAQAFVFLQRSKRFVVFTGGEHPRLHWFSAKGGLPIFSRPVAGMRPCFKAHYLGSDSRDKIFLSGKDGADFGGKPYVLIFDGDGNRLEDLPIDPLDSPVTGIAANRDSLFVTGPRGLLRFGPGEVVPVGDGQVRCAFITPALFSADREDGRRWLRAEVNANLPEGSTLEILYAATDKPEIRDRFDAIAKNDSIPGSRRVEQLLAEPDVWSGRTVFHGAGSDTEATKSFAAKLFDVTDRYLWVCVALGAGAGGRLPFISRLDVLYPGRSLMENLPAIYRKQEAEPGSFLRGLVGTLEMTTQELDNRIGSMGGRINPSTAKEPWLDFIARWLGVPWDDELSLTQKQAILARAPELAKGRGTRAGLEALLESLIPGTPRRFRVTDATADFGFAIVGESGGGSCGSTLPAMLGGNTRWSTELDSNAVLGYMRLGCEGQREDGVWQLAGKVRVEVAATASERKAWEPWLTDLIAQMISLTARVEFRWVTAESLRTTDLLDGTMTLGPDPIAHLGTDAITSLARLPRRGTRLSGTGPVVGTRLDR
jgi:phage tail-like protein